MNPLLGAASAALGAVTSLRRSLHRRGRLPTRTLPAPVLSVGNLAAGGTGKTPLVEHVARLLHDGGARPVVVSRGYGPVLPGSDLNDEGTLLRENLPWLAQRQSPDRATAGAAALAAGEGDCILLDDGFQHVQLARDLDIVALDALRPFHGGLRREGPAALSLAGVVVLTRAGRAGEAALARSRAAVARHAPGAALVVGDHVPLDVVPLEGGSPRDPSSLAGRTVLAASGIADPGAFEETLGNLGAKVVHRRRHGDHRMTGTAALEDARRVAAAAGADCVVVTQKDAVKLPREPAPPGAPPVLVLRVRFRVLEGAEVLATAVAAALDRGRARAAAR